MNLEKKKILVVEDDFGLQKQLRWSMDTYDVLLADDRDSALTHIRRHEPPVMTMDLGLPPDPDGASEGLGLLQEVLALAPNTKIIVLTGNQDHANAVKAIGMGAYDFHHKPFEPDVLKLIIERAFYLYEIQQENRRLQQSQSSSTIQGLITRDPGMLRVCRSVEKLAPSSATVMLLGESGTGKEVLARALHDLSPRKDKRFVAINCAAIPEHLLESELFGHEKGAFTGAAKQIPGKIELAHGGTFFLDEVGDLPASLQPKLLRFLQERVVERVGGRTEISIDVRVVCATHRNLEQMVKSGQFREDLYYRLSEIEIVIPPLRDRVGDATLLAHHYRNKFSAAEGRSAPAFSDDALVKLETHRWPGNVREIENRIKRSIIMADGPQITAEDLGLAAAGEVEEPLNLRQVRDDAGREALLKALARVDNNIVKAAEILGVSRPTLYDLMNRYGIK